MSKIKENIGKLIKKRNLIPDEFWVARGRSDSSEGRERDCIWILDQEDGTAGSYETSQERIGITRDGKVIWGFSSGCSCWGGWGEGDYCPTKEYKEFDIVVDFQSKRHEPYGGEQLADWKETASTNLRDFLVLVSKNPTAEEVLAIKNAEIRRYLIKRVGYENIKKLMKAEVLHEDGHNQLLKFENGEMYVKVRDHSTDREYLLFVEGNHKTCRSAIAWTFGLSEAEYQPIIET